MKSHTIRCHEFAFDLNFQLWLEKANKEVKEGEWIEVVSVSHDREWHYILYKVDFDPSSESW